MNQEEAINQIRAFTPTENEPADVHFLYELLEQLGETKCHANVRRELISIFERFPDASFGSPGPIVHSLEESPVDEHVEILAGSLQRRATVMTVWMAERCFRSELPDANRAALITALMKARGQSGSDEVDEAIDEALEEYG